VSVSVVVMSCVHGGLDGHGGSIDRTCLCCHT
jgi:hypothetical protein